MPGYEGLSYFSPKDGYSVSWSINYMNLRWERRILNKYLNDPVVENVCIMMYIGNRK